MTGKLSSICRQFGAVVAMVGLLSGLATPVFADFTDGSAATPAGPAYTPVASAATTVPASASPGCGSGAAVALAAQGANAQKTNNAILLTTITVPGLISQNCQLANISAMLNNLESLFSGGSLGSVFDGLGDKLAAFAITAVCNVVNSAATSAINSELGSVASTGALGSAAASVASGALNGGQLGVANSLVNTASSAVGSAVSGATGGSAIGSTIGSTVTGGLSMGTSGVLAGSGLTGAVQGPSILSQILGTPSTTTTTTTAVQPGGLY
jgi:hypothetical protein